MVSRSLALALSVVSAGIILFTAFTRADNPTPKPQEVQSFKVGDYTLTGPSTHNNLTVYLIHGADRVKGKHYVTLQEAIGDKIVIVHETGNVNELQIENVYG